MTVGTCDSLKLLTSFRGGAILFKEAQDMPPGAPPGGMQPDVGQSPQTGSPDEMQAPESANQRQFEDDFGALAYQFVNDRAPALVNYMLGFEVVDRNEDGSKAVGIFGYKVDDDYYYVPAFFLNNQVRGVDMVLNKKTNQFVPLTEEWVDYIVNKHSIRIGSPASDEVRSTMRNPDLTFVQRPQAALGTLGKTASDQAGDAPWTPSEAWAAIKAATARIAEDPLFKEAFGGICGHVEKAAESSYIKGFMERTGGPECMSSFLGAMHDAGFANAALTLYKDAGAFWTDNLKEASVHVDRMRRAADALPKVRVVATTSALAKSAQDVPPTAVDEEDAPLSEEENARQIVEHDFTIEDRRPDGEAAKVTEDKALVDFEHRFQPPDGLGRHNFMMDDGLSREGVLLNAVVSPCVERGETLVCFDGEGDGEGVFLASADPRAMITTEFDDGAADSGDGLEALFDRAVPLSDVEIDPAHPNTYLFIDGKGNAAGPFALKSVRTDGDHVRFVTEFAACSVTGTKAPDGLGRGYGFMDWNMSDEFHDRDGRRREACGGLSCCCEPCEDSAVVSVGTFSGMPKKTGAGVIVPHDWRALRVASKRSWDPPNDGESRERYNERLDRLRAEYAEHVQRMRFASPASVLEQMKSEGVERIKVASDAAGWFTVGVDGASLIHGPMNYKKAAVDLVTRFGLRPRRAFSVLAKAASGEEPRLLVKVPAQPRAANEKSAQLVDVAMPAPQEQLPSIDPYTGVPVYTTPYVDMTQGQFTGVPGLPPEGGLTRDINMGGEMARGEGAAGVPDEHTDSMGQGALPIDEEAKRLAEDAAKAGQRHVFDQAAVGGLAKVYDTAAVVDSYIPDFMDTIDRLGRILFLFYWKHEDFTRRYGSDDVVQMEDSLRNVFKNMGSLTLQLKEKAVQKD